MSDSDYSTKLNSIQTIFCQFNFISDENGNKIIFENEEKDFKQYNYIVNEAVLNCETEDKNSYKGNLTGDKNSYKGNLISIKSVY